MATGEQRKYMGSRIQEFRERAGLSQTQLAKAMGIDVGSLRNWEQGRRMPQLDLAASAAHCLGVSLDELAGDLGRRTTKENRRKAKEKAKKKAAEGAGEGEGAGGASG